MHLYYCVYERLSRALRWASKIQSALSYYFMKADIKITFHSVPWRFVAGLSPRRARFLSSWHYGGQSGTESGLLRLCWTKWHWVRTSPKIMLDNVALSRNFSWDYVGQSGTESGLLLRLCWTKWHWVRTSPGTSSLPLSVFNTAMSQTRI
jgi:hypothetical protein